MKLQELIDKSILQTTNFTVTVSMMRSENDNLTFKCEKKYRNDITMIMSDNDFMSTNGSVPITINTPNATIINGMGCYVSNMTEDGKFIIYGIGFICVGVLNPKIASDSTNNHYMDKPNQPSYMLKDKEFIGSTNVKVYQLIENLGKPLSEPPSHISGKSVKLTDKLTEPEFKAILDHAFGAGCDYWQFLDRGISGEESPPDFETYYKQMYKD